MGVTVTITQVAMKLLGILKIGAQAAEGMEDVIRAIEEPIIATRGNSVK